MKINNHARHCRGCHGQDQPFLRGETTSLTDISPRIIKSTSWEGTEHTNKINSKFVCCK